MTPFFIGKSGGGAAADFNPDDVVPGNMFIMDPREGPHLAKTADRVSSWTSTGFSALSFIPSTPGNEPVWSSTALNGTPGLDIQADGLSALLSGPAFLGGGSGEPLTVFATLHADPAATTASRTLFENYSDRIWARIGSGNWAVRAPSNYTSAVANDGAPHVYALLLDGADTTVFIDGAEVLRQVGTSYSPRRFEEWTWGSTRIFTNPLVGALGWCVAKNAAYSLAEITSMTDALRNEALF